MAGGSTCPDSKGSSHKPSSSSSASHRKSRWDATPAAATTSDPKLPRPNAHSSPKPRPTTRSPAQPPNHTPISAAGPGPGPALGQPPPPPKYGFHMLERRSIVLADGSVRSYFALPPDYQDFPLHRPVGLGPIPPVGPVSPAAGPSRYQDYWSSLGLDAPAKRKYSDEEDKDRRRDGRDGFADKRPNGEEPRASKYKKTAGSHNNGITNSNEKLGFRKIGGGDSFVGVRHLNVDQTELKKAFLRFAKIINEDTKQKKNYLENIKRLQCVACGTGRSSRDFPDMHSLIMHSYNFNTADLRVDHLGLYGALCVLMGWNYSIPPDNSKAYQSLSADEAAANQDDLVIWPPTVIIHNTLTGKNNFGRMEGLGNKIMDAKIRDLGFYGGKPKSLYGREGHLGITLIKFSGNEAGLKEAIRLAEYFERDNRGRKAWASLQPLILGTKDDENNPHLMKLDERTQEKKRIFYGYLGIAADLDKIDFDTRRRVAIESLRDYKPPE